MGQDQCWPVTVTSGKSFATKLTVLRGLTGGVTAYIIEPEGEYADMTRAAGGRVLSPGVPGERMNPFVIDREAARRCSSTSAG